MSTDKFSAASGFTADMNADVWSRPGSSVILPGGAATGTDRAPAGSSHPAAPIARDRAGTAAPSPAAGYGDDAFADEVTRTTGWSAVVSGPALAIAAFAFALGQTVGGLVAGPVTSLIPGAADSPANHVRIIAVIYIGMSCAGAVLAWVALRRIGDDAEAPKWASYLAGAAMAICALVALQALLLLMLSILAPAGA